MTHRITVDSGGTFTDVTLDDGDTLHAAKAPTTPHRFSEGLLNALEIIAQSLNQDVGRILGETDVLIYATTHATNAIIEGSTARTALLLTEGFPDTLVLRQAGKLRPYDISMHYPEPYIPRRYTYEIPERISADGEVLERLDEEAAANLLTLFREIGIEAVAVCLLWSIVNPVHEQRLGSLINELLPDIPYTLSHELNPVIREYPRASATSIDASLKPLVQKHLRQVSSDLHSRGFLGELLLCSSSGGVQHLEDAASQPILMVRSGPSMVPVAGRHFSKAERLGDDVLVCDVGGTSFDVSLVRDGTVNLTRETWLGPPFEGQLISMPTVDVRSVGAGGGSIAWIDPGGLLRVGPHSAGADPGPACYERGGSHATVTDAALVLGYLPPEGFAGGRMNLSASAAKAAMEPLGSILQQSAEEVAQAIFSVASQHMVNAIEEVTIKEGFDPRSAVLVAGGGAAGLNIVQVADQLDCSTVLVPRLAGVLSASGAQVSNIVRDFSVTCYANSTAFPYHDVNEALETLDSRMDLFCDRLRARGLDEFDISLFAEARYPYQVWELPVPLSMRRFRDAADVERLIQDFHEAHERVFAVRESGQSIECISWRGRVTAVTGGSASEGIPASANGSTTTTRNVIFGMSGPVEATIYDGRSVSEGQSIKGPSIIEEPTTTLVLWPGATAEVSALGNYVIRVR